MLYHGKIGGVSMSSNDYYTKVKERLIEEIRRYYDAGFIVNVSRITDIIIDKYHIDTSYQIIQSIFKPQDKGQKVRKIPLAELVALCDILQIPISKVSQFENMPSQELNPPWLIPKNPNQDNLPDTLTNPFYYGDYYCYYFKAKPKSNARLGNQFPAKETMIKTAKLKISEKNDFSYATLTETLDTLNFEQNRLLENFVYEGKVYYLSKPNQIYTALMDQDGKHLICLMFDFHNYTKDVMYYRTAAMLTSTIEQHPRPIYQKMIILRSELDLNNDEHLRTLRGMLSLESHKLLVKKEDLAHLINDYPELSHLNHKTEEYASFSEYEILNQQSDMTYEQKKNLILLLRQNSSLNIQNVAGEDFDFSDMVRRIQQEARKL